MSLSSELSLRTSFLHLSRSIFVPRTPLKWEITVDVKCQKYLSTQKINNEGPQWCKQSEVWRIKRNNSDKCQHSSEITALGVRKESCRSNYHKNSFIAAIYNKIKQANITFPKEPWPRTLSNSNCEGSALRQALELTTSLATSIREEDASSTGCGREEGKKWANDRTPLANNPR